MSVERATLPHYSLAASTPRELDALGALRMMRESREQLRTQLVKALSDLLAAERHPNRIQRRAGILVAQEGIDDLRQGLAVVDRAVRHFNGQVPVEMRRS